MKRIFTLLAGFALFGAMTAMAQTTDPSIKLKLGANEGLYQLEAKGGQVLSVGTDRESYTNYLELKDAPTSFDPNSYWCVTVTQENKGQTPIYDFINKGAQCFLDVSMDLFEDDSKTTDDEVELGGEIGGWAYSKTFEEGIAVGYQPLFSYFTHDSVVYVMDDCSLLKQLASDPVPDDALLVKLKKIDPIHLSADAINAKLGLLSEKDYGNVKLTFVPDRNKTSLLNPFSDLSFRAEDAEDGFVNIYHNYGKDEENNPIDSLLYVDTAYTNVNGAKFLAFKHAAGTDALDALMTPQSQFEFTYFPTNDSLVIQVRQAIYTPGDKGTFASAGDQAEPDKLKHNLGTTLNDGEGQGQGNFVTVQDLIKADQIRIVTIRDEKESDINLGYKGCATSSDLISLTDSVYTIKNANGQYLAVPIANCSTVSGLENIGMFPPGLRLPSNLSVVTKADWITVDPKSQDVDHMPAYQWVIVKSKTNKYFDSTSPVIMFNREYPRIYAQVQLHKDSVNNVTIGSVLRMSTVDDPISFDPEEGPVYNEEPSMTALYGESYYYDEGYIPVPGPGRPIPPYYIMGSTVALNFTPVKDITDGTIGYKRLSDEEMKYNTAMFAFNYFNPYDMTKFISKSDTVLTGMGDSTAYFNIDTIPYFRGAPFSMIDEPYGFGTTYETHQMMSRIPTLAQLVRTPYMLRSNGKYAGVHYANRYDYPQKGDSLLLARDYYTEYYNGTFNPGDEDINPFAFRAVPFYFKENNHYDGKHYYALMVASGDNGNEYYEYPTYGPSCLKVGVADNSLDAVLQLQCGCENRTSAFAIEVADMALYRHFNNANLGEKEGKINRKFYETTRHEYLMDENNINLQNKDWEKENSKTIDYLGIWTANKASLNGTALGLQLDTVWINRGLGNIKPQYLISVAHKDVVSSDTIPCTETTPHHDVNGNVTDAMHCAHAIPGHAGFEYGKYLVSFADSCMWHKNHGYVHFDSGDVPYTDVKDGYVRVAFLPAIHITDTLIILTPEDAMVAPDSLNPAALIAKYQASKNPAVKMNIIPLTGDNHKNVTWSFRYTNPGKGAKVTAEGPDNSFLIESNNNDGQNIAPEYAAWMKMQNGCLCLTKEDSEFNNAKTGGDGALIFNVEPMAEGDALVTDAATVTASDFAVIAGQGQVTINGAAGKKVVISNILGQTVANTVLTSDNATIAAPAGVVVVAVEGEAAVKAIVK